MYDFSVVSPESSSEAPWPLVKQALEMAFGLKAHTEMKDTRVYVLRKIAGQLPVLKVETRNDAIDIRNGQVEATGYPIGGLTRTAGHVLGSEVLDETGLNDRYDCNLKWDPNQPHSIIRAIREQLNRELVMTSLKLEYVAVDSITEARTR